jgi:hypothetical protein
MATVTLAVGGWKPVLYLGLGLDTISRSRAGECQDKHPGTRLPHSFPPFCPQRSFTSKRSQITSSSSSPSSHPLQQLASYPAFLCDIDAAHPANSIYPLCPYHILSLNPQHSSQGKNTPLRSTSYRLNTPPNIHQSSCLESSIKLSATSSKGRAPVKAVPDAPAVAQVVRSRTRLRLAESPKKSQQRRLTNPLLVLL